MVRMLQGHVFAPGIFCFSKSYAEQQKISVLDFFRSLNPSGEMRMPVGEFRKAMIQVRGFLVARGTVRVCACVGAGGGRGCVLETETETQLEPFVELPGLAVGVHLLYLDPEGPQDLLQSPTEVLLCIARLGAPGDPRCRLLRTHSSSSRSFSPLRVATGQVLKGSGRVGRIPKPQQVTFTPSPRLKSPQYGAEGPLKCRPEEAGHQGSPRRDWALQE